MSATQLGTTTGNWGIGADETGLVIQSLTFDYQTSDKEVKNRQGCATGISVYDERVEISYSGVIEDTAGPTDSVGDSITLSNAVSYTHLQAVSGGTTVLKNVQISEGNEQFEEFSGSATLYPLVV